MWNPIAETTTDWSMVSFCCDSFRYLKRGRISGERWIHFQYCLQWNTHKHLIFLSLSVWFSFLISLFVSILLFFLLCDLFIRLWLPLEVGALIGLTFGTFSNVTGKRHWELFTNDSFPNLKLFARKGDAFLASLLSLPFHLSWNTGILGSGNVLLCPLSHSRSFILVLLYVRTFFLGCRTSTFLSRFRWQRALSRPHIHRKRGRERLAVKLCSIWIGLEPSKPLQNLFFSLFLAFGSFSLKRYP